MSKYNYLFDAEEKMYKMENNTSRIKEFIRNQVASVIFNNLLSKKDNREERRKRHLRPPDYKDWKSWSSLKEKIKDI